MLTIVSIRGVGALLSAAKFNANCRRPIVALETRRRGFGDKTSYLVGMVIVVGFLMWILTWTDLVNGIVLVAAVALSSLLRRRQQG